MIGAATSLIGSDGVAAPRPAPGPAARLAAFAPTLREFVRRRVRCPATADDLAQDVLARAWRALPGLRQPDRVEAWLYRLARRRVIDHYRRSRPSEENVIDSLAQEAPDPAAETAGCVARAARCYLGTLPPAYRDAVRLADEDGLPHAEVARRLGISLPAAKARIRRGKQMVRALLEAECHLEFDRFGRVVDCAVKKPARG